MDPDQSLSQFMFDGYHQSLLEVLSDVEAVDNSIPRRYCCWQDVIDAIETAKAQDDSKADKSVLRARLRKSAAEIAVLESLTNMIPDQDGLSILRGGMATLCKMVALRLETRAMILRAFEVIPETFVDAVQAGLRFPDAPDLVHAVRQLYAVLVDKVATLIGVLLRSHPHRNKVVRLWKQLPGKEAEIVRSCLEEISRAVERVSQCSRAALERTVREIRLEQHTIHASTDLLSADVKAVKSGVEGIQAAIADGVTRLESRLYKDEHEKHLQAVAENSRKMVEAASQILRRIQDSESDLGWYQQQQHLSLYGPRPLASPWLRATALTTPRLLVATTDQMQYEPLSPPPSPACVSTDTLLEVLDVPGFAAAEALACVVRLSSQLKDTGGWSNRLMSMGRFREWLEAPWWASDLVLVDGHCGNAAANKVSPVSATCASLAGILLNAQDNCTPDRPAPVVLHHFCGQHLGFRNPLRGPAGLIRSLIRQLLVQSHEGQSGSIRPPMPLSVSSDELFGGVEAGDIPSLCRLFSNLILALEPSRPVFCIVDGVSEVETVLDGWQDDTCFIINALLDLVEHSPRAGPAVRVLLTSAERSTELAESIIPRDRRVSLLTRNGLGKRLQPMLFERDVNNLLMAGELEETPDIACDHSGGLGSQRLTQLTTLPPGMSADQQSPE